MNILFAASESVPFCKTGGLGDVVGALTEELAKRGHSVLLVLPYYQQIRTKFPRIKDTGRVVQIPLAGGVETVRIRKYLTRSTVKTVFVESHFFDRDGLYGGQPGTSFDDNDRRFALFSRATIELSRLIGFKPDIFHCHDWQTGLIPAYLKYFYKHGSFFSSAATVFTIHNMAYQGNFPQSSVGVTGLPWSAFHSKEIEFYGQVSYLKSGLVYSDAINTVSPTYAKEIRSGSQFGCGLEGVLRDRKSRFRGITNGLNVKRWNPSNDPYLLNRFHKAEMANRAKCKADLQESAGLPVQSDLPVLGFIGRLDQQKGIDILIGIAPSFLKEGIQFVCLGQGNPVYVASLLEVARRYPSQVRFETTFSEPMAHKIYAGSDIFLMPSRYEPCGLGQLIAMRYGAIPVVTPTGGLLDTVKQVEGAKGTGFVSKNGTPGAYLDSVMRAVKLYSKTRAWRSLQKRAMTKNHSWASSLPEYISLYHDAIKWTSGKIEE